MSEYDEGECLFGEDYVQEVIKQRYGFTPTMVDRDYGDNSLDELLDHGFFVNGAHIWLGLGTDTVEWACVSRTYCSDEEIDNPPEGLKCQRVPEFMGKDNAGTAIATYIVGPGAGAEAFLLAGRDLSANDFPCLLHYDMLDRYDFRVRSDRWFGMAKVKLIPNPPPPEPAEYDPDTYQEWGRKYEAWKDGE